MIEPEEFERWQRMARALALKADDAEGLAQVLDIVDLFEAHAMTALDRLLADGVYSYAYLATGLQQTKQALHQRHARYLARPAAPAPEVVPMRRSGWWRWRCRCGAWAHTNSHDGALTDAAQHASTCAVRPSTRRARNTTATATDTHHTELAS